MQLRLNCAWCGKEIWRYESQVGKHNFCSRKCRGLFSSKTHNPSHYAEMFNIEKMSAHMSALNRELNPTRMTPQVREKIRQARLGSGASKTYAKAYGRHEHRVIAEQKLGRKLRPGEIVHHIDCNKRNNHPDNLKVMTQAEHAALHARLNKFFDLGGVGA